MMQILIAGTDRTDVIDLRSLSLTDAIGERSALRFSLSDIDGSLTVARGQEVGILLGGETTFGGTIDRIIRRRPGAAKPHRIHDIDCVDWHQLADRHLVAESYAEQPAGAIVRDIVDVYLAAEGVFYDASSVQDGPTVRKAVFNYVPASQALEELGELVGFLWWLDADKRIHFVERATYEAPWVLDSDDLVNNLVIEEPRDGYRNRQYIRAGQDITDPRIETFVGDGASKTFTLKFPVATQPTVRVNTVNQTVGIWGVRTTGYDWYWNKGDPNIKQDDAAVPLTEADTLEVTYQGLFPIIVVAEDPTAVLERQAVEGGTGIYEAIEDEPNLDDREAALDVAQGFLRKYARLNQIISFYTHHSGLRPGQILRVNLPDRGLDGGYLVQEVTLSRLGGEYWRYDVRAVSGETVGGWAQFFRKMARQGRAFVIRENEVLTKLKAVTETLMLSDTLTKSTGAPESRVGYAMVGYSEVAG